MISDGANTYAFKHRFVEPRLPPISSYMDYLQSAYDRKIYSNFGPLTALFEERAMAKYGGGAECCVTVTSATAGLSAALLASGVSGRVLVPAFTFPASLGAVKAAGLEPVIIDVDAASWAASATILKRAFDQEKPGGVMLVAPFGMNYSFAEEIAFCREQGVPVIIDNAAGLGVVRTPRCSQPGIFEVFSLHATKTFAVGEGGVVFAHESHQRGLRSVTNFGLRAGADTAARWGFNGKLSEFHAAIALAQLDNIDEAVRCRRLFAASYYDRIAVLRAKLPVSVDDAPWQCMPLLCSDEATADALEARSAREGVELRRYYRPSLSRWPEARALWPCENAEDLAVRMCALPVRGDDDAAVRLEIVNIIAEIVEELEGNGA